MSTRSPRSPPRDSNREIAVLLSISETTVESHLSHILAKLGVCGRAAVARATSRAGPVSVVEKPR